tara:strand:+ start:212 stop:406 length:195 start_codon:yes stop_codon:yes gene_type:complete
MSASAGLLSKKRPVTAVIVQQKAKESVKQVSGLANQTAVGARVLAKTPHNQSYATEKMTIATDK